MEYVDAKSILHKTKDRRWFGSDFTINMYRGCCHGCIYCDSRSNCYGIKNFDQVKMKKDGLLLLEKELHAKKKKGIIGIGSMSDPYNPFEEQLQITRKVLELIRRYGFGVALDTKSDLVTRDIDRLVAISKQHPCIVKVTITAASDALSKKLEPNVCTSSHRFAAIASLRKQNIFAGVLLTPLLPFITDTKENIAAIVQQARECDANFIYCQYFVTLRENQRDYFYEQLDHTFPNLHKQYQQTFANQYVCQSPKQKHLRQFLEEQCERSGILFKIDDIIAAYQKNYFNQAEQLTLPF